MHDPFHARDTFETGSGPAGIYRLTKLEEAGLTEVRATALFDPRAAGMRCLRNCDGYEVTEDDVKNLAGWKAAAPAGDRSPLQAGPRCAARFHRRAGVVDLAAMRSAMKRLGRRPEDGSIRWCRSTWSSTIRCRSISSARQRARWPRTCDLEFQRNRERYEFLRWGQKALRQFPRRAAGRGDRPPGQPGIPGQVRVPARGCGGPGGRCPTRWSAPTATPR